MAISTYSELKSTIADFMQRTDAVTAIPGFVTLAEAQMNRALQVRHMIARASAVISAEYASVPSDYAGGLSLDLTDNTPPVHLEYASPDTLRNEKALRATLTGTPEMFSVQGSDIQFFPAPTETLSVSLVYYAVIPPLSDSVQTNWLLQSYPDAYLYGSLVNAGFWLRGDPRLADWTQAFLKIISDIQDSNKAETAAPRLEMPSRMNV